jgi:hypothetical protein
VAYSDKARAAIPASASKSDAIAGGFKSSTPAVELLGVKSSGPSTDSQTVFHDNFDSENNGRGQLNHRGFKLWYVGPGEVDLIGNGFMDYQPGNGLYVELDGSKSVWSKGVPRAGTLRSKNTIHLPPGKYTLEFALAGHPGQGPNTVKVQLTGLYQESFTKQAQAPRTGFQTISRAINVAKATDCRLIFEHQGGDWQGLLLDNVKLTKSAN